MTENQNNLANEAQTENIVKRILTSEVKYVLGIIIFLAGVVAPYYSIKQDIELIKQNHLFHIEQMQKDILKIQEENAENREFIIELIKVMSTAK